MKKQPAVYILSNQRHGTLYIGVTSNLVLRIWQHKNNLVAGFSQKYTLHKLVYFELLDDMDTAIVREKRLKKWNRKWKIGLIEEKNPEWNDLYSDIT
jgi:putative endonuclease